MANFAQYVAKETTSNLWRNRVTTAAAVFTVMISLFLVGASLVLGLGASNATTAWEKGTLVSVFMQPSATAQELAAIKAELDAYPFVHGCYYQTQHDDWLEAQKQLTATELSVLTEADIPSSYRCVPNQPQDAQLVIDHFSGQPGVFKVNAPVKTLKTLQRIITTAQWSVLIVALVLLASSAVLILNTIRMAIFARRREVAVMKLVGATNWFIRVPFIFEGLAQGFIGSALAAALVWGGEALWRLWGSRVDPGSLVHLMLLSNWQLFFTEVVVVLVGMVIGALGSAIAIRRFLDV